MCYVCHIKGGMVCQASPVGTGHGFLPFCLFRNQLDDALSFIVILIQFQAQIKRIAPERRGYFIDEALYSISFSEFSYGTPWACWNDPPASHLRGWDANIIQISMEMLYAQWMIKIVLHIIIARPKHLHGRTDRL